MNAAFSSDSFSTDAFSVDAWSFGSEPPPVVIVAGSGGGGVYRRRKWSDEVINEAFANHGVVEEIYVELVETKASARAADVIRAYARSDAAVPTAATVDWQTVGRDVRAVEALIALFRREEIEREDEEIMMLS